MKKPIWNVDLDTHGEPFNWREHKSSIAIGAILAGTGLFAANFIVQDGMLADKTRHQVQETLRFAEVCAIDGMEINRCRTKMISTSNRMLPYFYAGQVQYQCGDISPVCVRSDYDGDGKEEFRCRAMRTQNRWIQSEKWVSEPVSCSDFKKK